MQSEASIFTLCLPSNVSEPQVIAGHPRFMHDWQALHCSFTIASTGPLILTGSSTQGRSEMITETPLFAIASRSVWYICARS